MIEVIAQTLAPVFLLILMGAALRQTGFLDAAMESSMNRFCYWVALPVFIVLKVAQAPSIDATAARAAGALALVTLALALIGIVLARLLRLPPRSRGTFNQAGFRGNLAFVGLPVIAFALRGYSDELQRHGQSLAVLTMIPTVLMYNLLGVMALEWDRRGDHDSHPMRTWIRSTLRNPLVLACVAGLIWNLTPVSVPELVDTTASPVAATAFPLALAAIGARIRSLPWHRTGRALVGVCLLKNAIGPLLGLGVCTLLDLTEVHQLVVLILCATPTAVSSYVLVDQLDGDRDLAASAIAGTTLASFAGLAASLWLAL